MYSELIADHFMDPGFVGDVENPALEFEIGNSVCGDRIRVQAAVTDGNISEIAYRAWGCATSVATGDIFCESVKDTALAEVASRTPEQIEAMLGELEPSQHHCVQILTEMHQSLLAEAQTQGVI